MLNKRDFLKFGAAGSAAALLTGCSQAPAKKGNTLENITGDATPISVDERKARIAKVQKNMQRK